MLDSHHQAEANRWGVLVAQARAGSAEALGTLLEDLRPYLLQVANAEMPADLRAKLGGSDLVQQTFLEAKKDFQHFAGNSEAELVGWLRTMLRDNLANWNRHYRGTAKRLVAREVPLGGSALVGAELVAREPSPSTRALAQEQSAALEHALSRLPDDYRQVIELRSRDQLPFAEIATRMQRSPEAVRKLWARALARLQQEMPESAS